MPDVAQTISPVPIGDASVISKDMGSYMERVAGDLRRDLYSLRHEDSTFWGAIEIDGSVDISGALFVEGSVSFNSTEFSDCAVSGDFSVDGTAVFGAKAIFESDVSGIGYVDRGDPVDVDYDGTVAFGTFGAWTELDLPSDVGVPTDAKAVSIYAIVTNNTAGVKLSFRDSGDSNTGSRIDVRSQVGGMQTSSPMIVSSANGKIDYWVDDVGVWSQLAMVVLGWWL